MTERQSASMSDDAPEDAPEDAPMPAAMRRAFAMRAVTLGAWVSIRLYGAFLIRFLGPAALEISTLYALLFALQWVGAPSPIDSIIESLIAPGPVVWLAIGLPIAYIAIDLYYRFSGQESFRQVFDHFVNWGSPKLGLDVPSRGQELTIKLWALRRYLRVASVVELAIGLTLVLLIASAFTWGLTRVLGADALFRAVARNGDATGLTDHLVFWIWHVADLLMLEAPSALGWRFGALEARSDGYVFLTLVLAFRLSIVLSLAQSIPFLLGKALTPTAPTPARYSAHVERVLPEFWAYQAQLSKQEASEADTRSHNHDG